MTVKRRRQSVEQEGITSKIQKRDKQESPSQLYSNATFDHNIPISPETEPLNGILKPKPEDYRCPRCTFPCWLCHRKGVPKRIKSETSDEKRKTSDEEESDMSEAENSNSISKSSKNKRKRTDGLTYLGPKDNNFETCILRPIGVRIRALDTPSTSESLPDDGVPDDPSQHCQIHLEIDDSVATRISAQFRHYHHRKYDEVALTQLMTKWLARSDDYIDPDGSMTVSSLRRDIWKPRKQGPELNPALWTMYTYDWDIVPDITYMLTINLFKDEVREALRQPTTLHWLAAEPLGVCPYLTFELKCAEKTGKDSEAECQISVASVLWLAQWERLKHELSSNDFSDLRHYSIVVNSLDYQIWVTRLENSTYSVAKIADGSFVNPDGVKQYAKWSNAIHKWGLGTNARAFKRDVEDLWKRKSSGAGLMAPPLTRGAVQSLPQ